jgi:hypothetical protein
LGITFDKDWDPSKFETDLTEDFIEEHTSEPGLHYSRMGGVVLGNKDTNPSSSESNDCAVVEETNALSVANKNISFRVLYGAKVVNVININTNDSVESLIDVLTSFIPQIAGIEFYLCNSLHKVKFTPNSPSTVRELNLIDKAGYHLIKAEHATWTCYEVVLFNHFSHQVLINRSPDEVTLKDVYGALEALKNAESNTDPDFAPFPPEFEHCQFQYNDDITIPSYFFDECCNNLGIGNYGSITCIRELPFGIITGTDHPPIHAMIPFDMTLGCLKELLDKQYGLSDVTYLASHRGKIDLNQPNHTKCFDLGFEKEVMYMTLSEDLVGKIFLCFVDEADVSRICGVKGTLQNLTLADFVYNISTNDFDLSKLKININGVWCGIDDDCLNISLDDLGINEFHILYANLVECMIVERRDFEPVQDIENDVQSEGEIDNVEVEFVDSDDSVILCNDTDDPVSPHACPGVLKCPTCSMQVCKCIQIDTITEEGIENLIV